MAGGKKGKGEGTQEFKFDFGGEGSKGEPGQTFDFGGAKNELLPIIQKRLNTLVGASSGYMESLPPKVQERIRALKKIHKQKKEFDAEYQKEFEELEARHRKKLEPLFERRSKIVTGQEEPTPEEAAFEEETTKEKKESPEDSKKEAEEEKTETKEKESSKEEEKDIKGIPDFWLVALKHTEDFGEMITKKDEEALKYLRDVVVRHLENEGSSFAIDFHFDENPFFENNVLTKTYHLTEDELRGETMFKEAEATEINWKPKKNLTVKLVQVQQKGGRGGRRGGRGGRGGRNQAGPKIVTVEKPTQSFFNFFSPDSLFGIDPEEDIEDEDMQDLLEADYELGLTLKEQVIPNAVLWFTGEIADQSGLAFGEEEDSEEGEYDSSEDPDFEPGKDAPQPECKQQ